MTRELLRRLLEEVKTGRTSVEEALRRLEDLPFEDLGTVRLDHHRALRRGFPEVIYAPGKTLKELKEIVSSFLEKEVPLVVTRVEEGVARSLLKDFPQLNYHERARVVGWSKEEVRVGLVAVVSAGTADLPVAEEARVCAEYLGSRTKSFYDVGVAGIHRLFSITEELKEANVVIVVAGMEGALPSVVAGLLRVPVVAVPTSVGYGTSLGGISALLTMLNSCALGVTVVNIDNGVGAAYFASMINKLIEEKNNGKKGQEKKG